MKVVVYISSDKNDTFCQSKESLLKFISVDDAFSVRKNRIECYIKDEKINAEFELNRGRVFSTEEVYFDLVITSTNESEIDKFSSLVNKLINLLERINTGDKKKINVIWNDIEKHYAQKAYPLIYETENLMRNLISKFMLQNLGTDWFKNSIHPDIKDKIKSKKTGRYKDELYKIDFIALTEYILFKKYRDLNMSQLDKIVRGINDVGDVEKATIKSLKSILPRSNWDRYFSKIIDESEDKLVKQWKQLYEIRNLVAHNVGLSKNEFEQLSNISGSLNVKLKEANNKIKELILSEGQLKSMEDFFKDSIQSNPDSIGPVALFICILLLAEKFNENKN